MTTDTFTMRAATPADFPRLVEIAHTSARERGIDRPTTVIEDYEQNWRSPTFDPDTMSKVVEIGGTIVATADIDHQNEQAWTGGYVLTEHRDRGIGSELITWGIERARTLPGVTELWAGAAVEIPSSEQLLKDNGFEHVRSWFRMRNTAPADVKEPEWPEAIELRALTGDALIDAAIAAYDGSFIDHFNFHPADRGEWERWVATDSRYNPALCHFAYDGDRLAGFCINQLFASEKGLIGDLGPIGTMRSHRKIGLGRALLRHATRELARAGAVEVTLGVDSENPNGAVRLYTSNGYVTANEGHSYRIKL